MILSTLLMLRIGIDFGMTIGEVGAEPIPDSFKIIKMIVAKHKKENVFIVSKARLEMQTKIKNWLDLHDFYQLTGFDSSNLIFVENYEDKRTIIIEKKIDVFIDDTFKVIKSIMDLESLKQIIFFHQRPEPDQLNEMFPIQYRSKIVITTKWNKIWSYAWNRTKQT